MNNKLEKPIDRYNAEYREFGLLGKKMRIGFWIYERYLAGYGYFCDEEISERLKYVTIWFKDLIRAYEGNIEGERFLFVDFKKETVLNIHKKTVAFYGCPDIDRWIKIINDAKLNYKAIIEEENKIEEENRLHELRTEEEAVSFYEKCYQFHIQDDTPIYPLFNEKNKVALIYVGKDKSLNFLKIDGYGKEEHNGVIPYEKIHYYEKAGDVYYVSDIKGSYSSYGGSMTGGSISKLATIGGGLLFGIMGMAAGAVMSYEPAHQEPIDTKFNLESEEHRIDERSIILNFYSDERKQYIDIELPQDIYNFLQTHLPQKKYGIVSELEKKTALHQAESQIKTGEIFNIGVKQENARIEEKTVNPMEEFKAKVEKLKIMKEAGMLSDEEFNAKRDELLNSI